MNTTSYLCGAATVARPLNSKIGHSAPATTDWSERRLDAPETVAQSSREGSLHRDPFQEQNWTDGSDWAVPEMLWHASNRVRFECETVFPQAQFSSVFPIAARETDPAHLKAEIVRVHSPQLRASNS